MSLTNAFATPYPFVRDSSSTKESLSVPLLNMDQIAAFVAMLEKRRSALLRKTAVEYKLSPEASANHVAMGEREEIEIFHLRNLASTIKGADEILKTVISPEDLAALSLEERRECARAAVGWLPEKKPAGDTTTNPSSAGAT